jgi:hypothetical protein
MDLLDRLTGIGPLRGDLAKLEERVNRLADGFVDHERRLVHMEALNQVKPPVPAKPTRRLKPPKA